MPTQNQSYSHIVYCTVFNFITFIPIVSIKFANTAENNKNIIYEILSFVLIIQIITNENNALFIELRDETATSIPIVDNNDDVSDYFAILL